MKVLKSPMQWLDEFGQQFTPVDEQARQARLVSAVILALVGLGLLAQYFLS